MARGVYPRLRCTDQYLTYTEQEIIQLIGQGMTNRGISEELGISANTVKMNTQIIYQKLGLNADKHSTYGIRAYLAAHAQEVLRGDPVEGMQTLPRSPQPGVNPIRLGALLRLLFLAGLY